MEVPDLVWRGVAISGLLPEFPFGVPVKLLSFGLRPSVAGSRVPRFRTQAARATVDSPSIYKGELGADS